MKIKGTIQENCPFCGRQAIIINQQDVAVCISHKDAYLNLKCVCGQSLDILKGRYGAYCNCLRCGNMSLKKALNINDTLKSVPINVQSRIFPIQKNNYKEKTINSDDPEYFD